MKTIGLAAILLFSIVHAAASGAPLSQPDPGFKLVQQDSTGHGFVIEHYLDSDSQSGNFAFQIWIADEDHPTSRTFLQGNSLYLNKVLVSPDGRRLAVNTKILDNEKEIKFYKRVNGLQFERDEALEQAFPTWRFMQKLNGWPSEPAVHHSHAECVAWSHDGSAILIRLQGVWDAGGGVPRGSMAECYYVFDLKTMKPTLDLSVMNRHTVSLEKPNETQHGLDKIR